MPQLPLQDSARVSKQRKEDGLQNTGFTVLSPWIYEEE
jgi:hypothetical protein